MGVGIVVLVWLVALSAFDIRHRRLPNWLTVPGAVIVVGVGLLSGRGAGAVYGALGLLALYLVVHLISPRAMGGGDVKLAIGLGALTGAFGVDVWLLAALGAPLLTSGLAVGAALRGGRTVPHGPSMCVASAAAIALVLV